MPSILIAGHAINWGWIKPTLLIGLGAFAALCALGCLLWALERSFKKSDDGE